VGKAKLPAGHHVQLLQPAPLTCGAKHTSES
jgi:hypothetical protein